MSLLTVLAFAACSDGLDNIEYDRNSGITIATAQVTATTGTSLTVTASATGNIDQIVKKRLLLQRQCSESNHQR